MAIDPLTDPRPELLGSLFVLVQHISRRMDEALEPMGLTSRQWLLLAVLQHGFPDVRPTLTEAAASYGTSRQNVKEIALGLERRGWVRLVPDAADRRATRIEVTARMAEFDQPQVRQSAWALMDDVFAGVPATDLAPLRDQIAALLIHLAPAGQDESRSPLEVPR